MLGGPLWYFLAILSTRSMSVVFMAGHRLGHHCRQAHEQFLVPCMCMCLSMGQQCMYVIIHHDITASPLQRFLQLRRSCAHTARPFACRLTLHHTLRARRTRSYPGHTSPSSHNKQPPTPCLKNTKVKTQWSWRSRPSVTSTLRQRRTSTTWTTELRTATALATAVRIKRLPTRIATPSDPFQQQPNPVSTRPSRTNFPAHP